MQINAEIQLGKLDRPIFKYDEMILEEGVYECLDQDNTYFIVRMAYSTGKPNEVFLYHPHYGTTNFFGHPVSGWQNLKYRKIEGELVIRFSND